MTTQYRDVGVDLDAADAIKTRIGAAVGTTRTALVRGAFGGFGGMFALPEGYRRPLLVMSTDGVGTKVLVAVAADRHQGIGEDLVNHSVNDILVHGARPIAFQDYLALGRLDAEVVTAVVDGIARGCREHAMSLTGGETAQLPDLYAPGCYDLAGTILGVVDEPDALHGDRVRAGDVVVGYEASGLHTNGYTLARRVVFDTLGLSPTDRFPEHDGTVADVLLAVHRSYYRAARPALGLVHALAHVTGGGIPGNLVRVLPPDCRATIESNAWPEPALFGVLRRAGEIEEQEMRRVFNLGLGFLAVVPAEAAERVRAAATRADVRTWVVGAIAHGDREVLFR